MKSKYQLDGVAILLTCKTACSQHESRKANWFLRSSVEVWGFLYNNFGLLLSVTTVKVFAAPENNILLLWLLTVQLEGKYNEILSGTVTLLYGL